MQEKNPELQKRKTNRLIGKEQPKNPSKHL
jgi:hypothetical protein